MNAMGRKGQLTILILVGLMVLIGVIVFFVTKNNASRQIIQNQAQQAINLNAEGQILQSIVDDCIEKSFKLARDDPLNLGIFSGELFMEDYMKNHKTNSIHSCIKNTTTSRDESGIPIPYYFFFERGIDLTNQIPEVDIVVDQVNDKALTVSVSYSANEGNRLQLRSRFDSRVVELQDFTYSFPLETKTKIPLKKMPDGTTRVAEDVKLSSGDDDFLVIIDKDRTIGKDEDYTGLNDVTEIEIKVQIVESTDDPDFQSVGKTTYKIITDYNSGQPIYFKPKIEVRKDFSSDLAMRDRSKSFSFFIKIPQISIPSALQPYVGMSTIEKRPVPTYGDTVNNNLVGYLPLIYDEIYFYEESCLRIINFHLPDCPVTADPATPKEITFDCMCDNDYIQANERETYCYEDPGAVPGCDVDSQEPEALPCECDRFIIYCQDNKAVPKDTPPSPEEILEVLGLWPLDASKLLTYFDPSLIPSIISQWVTDREGALVAILEAVAQKDPSKVNDLLSLVVKTNPDYDPLVCAPRNYNTLVT
jgi:hypothetical protein